MQDNSKLSIIIKLFKEIPVYYESITKSDLLFQLIFSFIITIGVCLFVFRRKPLAQLAILLFNMIIIHNTKRIHVYLSDNQPKFIQNEMITQKYFEDDGKFVLFVLTLPLFIVSMLSSVNIVWLLVKETRKVHKEIELINQERRQKAEEKTD